MAEFAGPGACRSWWLREPLTDQWARCEPTERDRRLRSNDPALKAIGPYSTLAHWRSEGRGPKFIQARLEGGLSRLRSQRVAGIAHRRASRGLTLK